LLADENTITALHDLNDAAWHLELIARDAVTDVSAQMWEDAMQVYLGALNSFHHNARHELSVPGRVLDRLVTSAPAMPLAGQPTSG
jgi:hypothetical protein